MRKREAGRFDIVVVGAGIAGLSAAYFLAKAGLKPLLVDRSAGVATGGSGAAGAFISPRIGKGGALQTLTNEAFSFAVKFYKENFPLHFLQSGILRIPKNPDDASKFSDYEEFNHEPYERWSRQRMAEYGIESAGEGFFFPEAGDCNAQRLCAEMLEGIEFERFDVKKIERAKNSWLLLGDGCIECEALVLCCGYRNDLLDMRYMGVKGLWGSRGDYRCKLAGAPFTVHRDFTISAVRNGKIKIGATHIKSENPCMACDGRPLAGLEKRARELKRGLDIELVETYCGMRSGSRDFFPLVGAVIDSGKMLERYPKITKGFKAPLIYHERVYILNGLGGRGFVFAPLMAKYLSEYIVSGKRPDPRIDPDRLFYRWVRRV